MEYLEGYQIRRQMPLKQKFVAIWRLRIDERKTYEEIAAELQVSRRDISNAIKRLRNDYPEIARRLLSQKNAVL